MVSVQTSDLLIRYSSLSNSAGDAIQVFDSAPTITQSNIFNNAGDGLDHSTVMPLNVNAACNYWGDPSGPDSADNPTGTGQTVVGNAIVQPFRTQFFLIEDDNCTASPTAVTLNANATVGQPTYSVALLLLVALTTVTLVCVSRTKSRPQDTL